MKSSLLKELLDLGDAFEQAHPGDDEQTVDKFLTWASGRAADQPAPVLELPQRYTHEMPAVPTFIAQYLTKVYRYFRLYIKKAFETTPLLTFEDFISLIYLAEKGSMTKTDLVESTVNEKTSGMLVIKRLLDRGFVEQTDNADDKRSRCLTLTDAGMAMLQSVQPAVNQATTLLKGDLSADEQIQLGALLSRLDRFHEPLFLHHKEASLDELSAAQIRRSETGRGI